MKNRREMAVDVYYNVYYMRGTGAPFRLGRVYIVLHTYTISLA